VTRYREVRVVLGSGWAAFALALLGLMLAPRLSQGPLANLDSLFTILSFALISVLLLVVGCVLGLMAIRKDAGVSLGDKLLVFGSAALLVFMLWYLRWLSRT